MPVHDIWDYDNIVVTDEKGIIRFADLADLGILETIGVDMDTFIGSRVTDAYTNLSESTSTILTVLRTGEPILYYVQDFLTKHGKEVRMVNSTYPIFEAGKIIGAIEYAKLLYAKDSPRPLKGSARGKVFRKNNTSYTIDDIISINPVMLRMKEELRRVSLSDSAILIHGKTGTGKEVTAQAIHNLSLRYAKPFVSLNCGAIPANLVESMLFGTVKGGFTGSVDAKGLFEEANGGTLFLDEINSLDMNLQAKLLKAIEEKNIRRIGDTTNIQLDIRIISAVNEEPEYLLTEKKIREDLYYRLSVIEFELPPLSHRQEDIPVLLRYFLNAFNQNMRMDIKGIEPNALQCLCKYEWPGNVRELKNALESAFNRVEGNKIRLSDLPERIARHSENIIAPLPAPENKNLKTAVEDYEKALIQGELQRTGNKIAETARRLGVSKHVLKYKMDKYLLRHPDL